MASSDAIAAASEHVVKALVGVLEYPTTENRRQAAGALVGLRRLYEHDGLPDWAGRSAAYRDHIQTLYRQAGVPSDTQGGIQAGLRYHLGNVLRDIAPADELATLGLLDSRPRNRVRASRATSPGRRKARAGVAPGDPNAIADLVLDALRILKSTSPGREVEATLRNILDETLDLISLSTQPPAPEAPS